jgi:NAD+ diphosphatase
MNPKDAYKHCILCGGKLSLVKDYLVCTQCHHNHFINPAPSNGAIIENEKGEILLVKRKIEPMKGYWDLPGGFINANESLEASIKRELKEELNIDVEVNNIIGVYSDTYLYQEIIIPTLPIVVSIKKISGIIQVADDVSEYKFFPKQEVLDQKIAFKAIKQGLEDYLQQG